MTIKVEVKANNSLSELARKLVIPIVELGQRLGEEIIPRVQRGESIDGPFRKLGADSPETSDSGLYWVHPARPQPPGHVVKPTTSGLRGWAGYRSYRDYVDRLGELARDFTERGILMAAAKVRANGPGRAKLTFYGSHGAQPAHEKGGAPRRGTNTNVAFLASRLERHPMLMPNLRELKLIRDWLRRHMEAIAEAAGAQFKTSSARRAARAR